MRRGAFRKGELRDVRATVCLAGVEWIVPLPDPHLVMAAACHVAALTVAQPVAARFVCRGLTGRAGSPMVTDDFHDTAPRHVKHRSRIDVGRTTMGDNFDVIMAAYQSVRTAVAGRA